MRRGKLKNQKSLDSKFIIIYVIFVVILTVVASLFILTNIAGNNQAANMVSGFVVIGVDNLKSVDIFQGYFFPIASVLGVLISMLGIGLIAKGRVNNKGY